MHPSRLKCLGAHHTASTVTLLWHQCGISMPHVRIDDSTASPCELNSDIMSTLRRFSPGSLVGVATGVTLMSTLWRYCYSASCSVDTPMYTDEHLRILLGHDQTGSRANA